MRSTSALISLILLTLLQLIDGARKPESVLLSKVNTLTLRKDLKTTNNRVAAVPQLKCVGGNAKGLYEVDIMRCKNQGSDYDDENVQWTCSASLPPEFKLGSTDVICEGFTSSKDPYVLKGSCGVEYRLLLTDAGEKRYGRGGDDLWKNYKGKGYMNWPAIIFWGLFVAVLGWIIYAAFLRDRPNRTGPTGTGWGWGSGGGGAGGGGGGGRPNNPDPPPPYHPGTWGKTSPQAPAQEPWRPGFWTGMGLGGAASYLTTNRQRQGRTDPGWNWFNNDEPGGGFAGDAGHRFYNDGAGSSAWDRPGPSSSSANPSFSSTRHESSGFGSTSRR